MTDNFIKDASGINIPEKLSKTLSPISDVEPNEWNPNVMDTSMFDSLKRSIQKDGFIVPVLVRASKSDSSKWEIIDGEHRWKVAKDLGMENIPVVDCGDISDTDAKQITIRANALRGEFDSIQLAEMIKEMVSETSLEQVSGDLPYSAEKISGMLDLLDTEISIDMPGGLGDDDDESGEDQKGHSDFQSFEPDKEEFDHVCPRCKFEFNG